MGGGGHAPIYLLLLFLGDLHMYLMEFEPMDSFSTLFFQREEVPFEQEFFCTPL